MLAELKNQKNITNKTDELYILAKKRSLNLLDNAEFREEILSIDNSVDTFVAGYFKGFREALMLFGKNRSND